MPRIYSRAAAQTAEDEDDFELLAETRERIQTSTIRGSERVSTDALLERPELERGDLDPRRWVQSSNLDAPAARPGYVQRWVRDASRGEADTAHWMKKMREGWRPRDPATVPPAERALYPSAKLTDGREVIRVAGLVLCEMPVQVARQRELAIKDLINRQAQTLPESSEAITKRSRNLGPIHVDQNEVRVVRGRQVTPMVE